MRAAYERQIARAGKLNRDLDEAEAGRHCRLHPEARDLLDAAVERLELSERGAGRIRRVTRTIADLAGGARITSDHLAEAVTLRRLDRPP